MAPLDAELLRRPRHVPVGDAELAQDVRALEGLARLLERLLLLALVGAGGGGIARAERWGQGLGADHVARRRGRFELADGGTIFLDEIADMSLKTQAKVLRVLEEQAFERVGGKETLRVDVRVLAASNQNLQEQIALNRFREDLFYRLAVIPIEVPPLRQRQGDMPLLVEHFIRLFSGENAKRPKTMSVEAFAYFLSYDWPGNVRELENAMERAFILETSKELTDAFLPDGSSASAGSFKVVADLPVDGLDLEAYVENIQKGFLEEALRRSNGVQVKAAQLLRMTYRSFRHYLQKYNIPA